jgi:hypothetical protein
MTDLLVLIIGLRLLAAAVEIRFHRQPVPPLDKLLRKPTAPSLTAFSSPTLHPPPGALGFFTHPNLQLPNSCLACINTCF